MNINIETAEATLTHVNLNTEGNQENPVSRSDLDFECLADGEVIKTLTSCDDVSSWWDDDGHIRLLGVKNITSKAELQGATMKFGDLEISHVTVKKFSFRPLNGKQIEFQCQVQIRHTPEELTAIDKMQKRTMDGEESLRIFSKQEELFE